MVVSKLRDAFGFARALNLSVLAFVITSNHIWLYVQLCSALRAITFSFVCDLVKNMFAVDVALVDVAVDVTYVDGYCNTYSHPLPSCYSC